MKIIFPYPTCAKFLRSHLYPMQRITSSLFFILIKEKRDLYWNKVYSVKNYIPRLQTNNKSSTQNYSAIRTVNSNNDVN